MNDKIEKLQNELDEVYEELYELKSKKDKNYLFVSHFELINDIEKSIDIKLKEYKDSLYSDNEPTTEDFIDVLNSFKEYIKEYKKSYNL